MARLQILQLPEGASDDRAPFVLVVDECVPQRIALGADASFGDYWQQLADRIGARGVIVTPETVDIPVNDLPAGPLLRAGGDPDESDADEDDPLTDARSWARHGYEIGQRHCGWSDHGVAPAWLTEGWPRSFDSCEHSQRAAEYDTALTQVRTLASKRLDEDECSPQERHGYHDAMRAVLALLDATWGGSDVEPEGEE